MTRAQSRVQRIGSQTTQVMPAHNRGGSSYMGSRQYTGTRQYAATPQYSRTRYYNGSGYSNSYYGGSRYYYSSPGYYYGGGSYPYYGYYSGWPSSYSSYYGYGYSPYSYYPGSYYSGYPYSYSYYQPGYGSAGSTVAAVQQRLGELGFYRGVVDGVMGPRTRAAIAAFENTHGMFMDGVITTRLLNRMGLA